MAVERWKFLVVGNADPAGLKQALARWPNEVAETDRYIKLMQTHVALGGNPSEGRTSDLKGGPRGEGWIVNPSYHATQLPYYVRFLHYFDLPCPEAEYQQAILRFADYSLELLGGKPLDFDKLRQSTLSFGSQELGLKGGSKGAAQEVLWLRMLGPAFRTSAEVEVACGPDSLVVKVSNPLRLKLRYGAFCPKLAEGKPVVLVSRRPDGSTRSVSDDVKWGSGLVEWSASAGEYELRGH